MKLLIYSHFFAPSVAGVESIVLSLARGIAGLHDSTGSPQFEITLVTLTPAGEFADGIQPFRVIRQPSFPKLWRLIRKSDAVHLAEPALAPLVLAPLLHNPPVIDHQRYQTTSPYSPLLHPPS